MNFDLAWAGPFVGEGGGVSSVQVVRGEDGGTERGEGGGEGRRERGEGGGKRRGMVD